MRSQSLEGVETGLRDSLQSTGLPGPHPAPQCPPSSTPDATPIAHAQNPAPEPQPRLSAPIDAGRSPVLSSFPSSFCTLGARGWILTPLPRPFRSPKFRFCLSPGWGGVSNSEFLPFSFPNPGHLNPSSSLPKGPPRTRFQPPTRAPTSPHLSTPADPAPPPSDSGVQAPGPSSLRPRGPDSPALSPSDPGV